MFSLLLLSLFIFNLILSVSYNFLNILQFSSTLPSLSPLLHFELSILLAFYFFICLHPPSSSSPTFPLFFPFLPSSFLSILNFSFLTNPVLSSSFLFFPFPIIFFSYQCFLNVFYTFSYIQLLYNDKKSLQILFFSFFIPFYF